MQREINTASSNGFIPRCKDNGDFEPLQCQRTLGECWCVDESGIELPDSRTDGSPDCGGIDGNIFHHLCMSNDCFHACRFLGVVKEGKEWGGGWGLIM